MATSTIPSKYDATTVETLSGIAISGKVKLVRCGKIRQLTFDDAKSPSSGPFIMPTLQSSDRPYYLTQTVLWAGVASTGIVWLRTDGTFGQAGIYGDGIYNGTMTWVVA